MDAKENKRLVMEGYEMFQRGDIPRLLERYHDDALWIEPESETVPFAGRHQGKAEIARFFAQLGETTQAMRFEPADFIAEGDKVVVTGEATWQVKATGRTYDSPWVHVFTLRDGKVARFQSYQDTAASEKAFQPLQPGQAAARGGAALRH
jgi:ketosteroid isomerase-like protein